ncbi:hypothetical protein RRG08_061884 [Elysia crispata]|uniref:Uncharacterized protein n=1 Tax=Elysia crispata TaxID=231223 RepID=A0AAE1CIT4_9GAST|nr:hypothetical protein RRG08_061884 [Elysia crispata]
MVEPKHRYHLRNQDSTRTADKWIVAISISSCHLFSYPTSFPTNKSYLLESGVRVKFYIAPDPQARSSSDPSCWLIKPIGLEKEHSPGEHINTARRSSGPCSFSRSYSTYTQNSSLDNWSTWRVRNISNLRYVDDTVLVSDTKEGLQNLVTAAKTESEIEKASCFKTGRRQDGVQKTTRQASGSVMRQHQEWSGHSLTECAILANQREVWRQISGQPWTKDGTEID